MTRIQLCSGLLLRRNTVLLTRCRYPGEPQALWTLPGGRQEESETIAQAIVREFWEEAGLRVKIDAPAYVSESIDERHRLHVLNSTFFMSERDPARAPCSRDPNVLEVRFVPVTEAPALLTADVLRIPVAAALSGREHPHYFAFGPADIRVPFFAADGLSDRSTTGR